MSRDGPLIDLLARGAQDKDLLTTDIKNSLFKNELTKYTNFSRGSITVDFKGNGNWGSTIKFIIPRDGDLLSSVYLNLKLPEISVDDIIGISESEKGDYLVKWTDYIGNALIDKAKLKIGGNLIDEMYGIYMQIHTDLYDDDWNKLMMIGHDDYLNLPQKQIYSEELFIPLKFWFSEQVSKALPLIALNKNQEVEIEIKFTNFHQCYSILKKLPGTSSNLDVYTHSSKQLKTKQFEKISLETNMVYLSGPERIQVSKSDYEILITQVQRRQTSINTHNFLELNLNHLVKELIFFIQPNKNIKQGEIFNFGSKLKYLSNDYEDIKYYDGFTYNNLPHYHLLEKARILINGIERLPWKNYKYFYNLQNYEHYRNSTSNYIYLYSFSTNPLASNPSGHCNFNRINNAQLQFHIKQVPQTPITITNNDDTETEILVNGSIKDSNPGILTVYATNYNFLIIKDGIAGLKYN